MHTAIASESTVCWEATLAPFAAELPAGADWVSFVRPPDPTGDVQRLAQRWTWADEQNAALERAIPGRFVRRAVVKNANRDLALATASRCAAVVDPRHLHVVTQRFKDDDTWRLRGYAVPVLFPLVGDWPWEAIADLRSDRNVARFRAVLREVEEEAAVEAIGGDFEAAAHHAYERHLAEAARTLEGIGAVAKRAMGGILVGGSAGLFTYGMANPGGLITSTAAGAAVTTIFDVRKVIHHRRTSGWIAVHHRITGGGQPVRE
jgi:hypothetical protein